MVEVKSLRLTPSGCALSLSEEHQADETLNHRYCSMQLDSDFDDFHAIECLKEIHMVDLRLFMQWYLNKHMI